MFGFREFTEMGGLISYGSSNSAMWRRAASYADPNSEGLQSGRFTSRTAHAAGEAAGPSH
jgi:hypothetical protein